MQSRTFRLQALLLLVPFLGGCAGVQQSIHDAALGYKTSAAGLESQSLAFEYGELRILRTPELHDDRPTLVLDDPSDYDELMAFAMNEPPFIPWPVSSVMAREAYGNRSINRKIFEDLEADRDGDFRDVLTRIQAPTLVLWGSDDRIIDAANAPLVAEAVPDSRLVIIEGIAHMPMIEAPEKTAELMRTLISEAAGSTGEQAGTN